LVLGVRDEPFGLVENVLRVCTVPPQGYLEDWCDLHTEAFVRHNCDGFIYEACMEARYECEAGDLPEWFDENGIDPNDPPDPVDTTDNEENAEEDSSADSGGCSCSTGP